MLSDILFRLRSLFRKKDAERDLNDELRFHLDRQVEKRIRSGMSRAQALREVRLEFGGSEQVKEECRESHGVQGVEVLCRDLSYGLRMLCKSPGFTVAVLLTLALGIGATTAIFSIVYGVLLKPLPYRDAGRLVVLNETTPKVGLVSVSYPNFQDWRAQSKTFSQMAAVNSVTFNLGGIDQPEHISGAAVSPLFLSMLGVRPLLGRDFDPSEEKEGTAPVVLLGYPLWQSHFGGSRNVLGRVIHLDGRSYTIVGVLPPEFRSLENIDCLMPIGLTPMHERGERGDTNVVARLAPGFSFEQAKAEMDGIAARLAKTYPEADHGFGVSLRPIRDVFTNGLRPAILVLFGAVVFVLLIACANVANLLLMRGASRTREIALRSAIGASRGRIIGQILSESLLLAALGGILGIALAYAGVRGLVYLIPAGALAGATLSLNEAVLLFAAGAAVSCTFLFGLVPALQVSRPDVQMELKSGGRTGSSSKSHGRMRSALAVAEVALALTLLVGAGLMTKSLYRLLSVDPGFEPDRVVIMSMNLDSARYPKPPAILNFWNSILTRVRVLPGVESAALGTVLPFTHDHSRSDITLEGMGLPELDKYPHPDVHIVSPGYTETLGVRLLRGRAFTEPDRENSPKVAMINSRIAMQFYGSADPIGKRFHFGHSLSSPSEWLTIVGVVGDTKLYGLNNPSRLEVYVPFAQSINDGMNLAVKASGDPAALVSSIRRAIASVDKDQPVFAISTMREAVNNSVSTPRITLVLLGLFGVVALLLAAIGIYAVIAYSVAQRTLEIGIRVALGAPRGQVVRMILLQGTRIAAFGVLIGTVASLALTRGMASLLFSVRATDPVIFGSAAVLLMLIAVVACYVPAMRTLRVEPTTALRQE